MQSEAGERLHKFTAGLQLRAEIYEMRHKPPTWQVAAPQDASVDIWVPDFRVQEQPVPRVESLPAPTGRPVTLQDRELLNRPAAQVMSSLPGLAAVRGSKTLNQVFHDLLTEQFGDPSDWFSSGLFGPRPSDQTSVSAQQRRAFVSPLRLFGSLAQILRGAYSSESYQWGAVSGPEYRIELRAYVSGRPRLVPPRKKESSFYIEEGALLSRPSGTADGTAVTHQVAGQGGPTVKLPHDVVPGIQVSGRYGRTSNTSSSDSSQGTDYRIHTYTGRQYTVTLPLTFIATLHGAARNLLTSVMSLAGKGSTGSEQALDVADGIEAHLSISELAALLRTMRQVEPETPDGRLILGLDDQRNQSLLTELQRLNDVYEADQAALRAHREPDRDLDTVVYLPRRIAGRLGLGDAVIADVLLDPQRSARVLLDSGLELVEQLVPGATRLGSNTYAAGLHTNLADLTEPLAMRGGVPRYFNSGQTGRPVELNQFTVYTAQRGRALAITVKLLARPAQEFETDDDLRKIFGRQVPEADLEIHSLARRTQTRGHGAGSTSAQTATLSAPVPHAPAAVLRDFSPSLAGSHIRDVGRSADETYRHEDRFVTKTVDGSARAEIPFELAIGVTVEPVREVPGPLQVVPALLETAIRMLGPHHAALDRVGEWVGGHAVVEFIAEDGSRQPVTAQPPAGYHAPTVFGVNPMQHDGQGLPHQAGGGPLPGFQLHDVRAWAPYGGPPPQHKLSWFNGDQVLPDLATQVLPDNARFAEGAREIQRFVEGLAGAANSYRLLSQGGVTHTVTSRNWGMSMVYEGTLQIQVIAASPWRDPVDTLDTGTGEAAPIAVGEHTRAISEHFPSKAASSSASFNADRQLGLRAQASSDVGSPTSGSSHGPLTYATVALTGGETSGVGATTFGATRRALRLYPTDLTRNMLKQRDLLLVVKGSTRTRPLGWFTWGEPSVSERWLAATMETRVNQSFLPAERTTRTPTGLHLPSLGDTEADDERWRQQPGYDRWVFVDGKGVATRTGTRASGLTAPDIHEALNSHGFSAEEDLILSIDQASFRGDRSLAAELGRLRPNARILATDLPNTHGHANPTPWRLFTDGAMGHELVPDLDRSVQVAESRPPDNTRYAGPVLAVDSGNSWQGAAVTPEQIAALARQARRPVVAINVRPGLTENGPELTALRAVLQRFQWFGMRPTVVATAVTAEFERVINRYQPITIQLWPVGLGQVWRVADPSRTVLAQDAELTAALFDNGDRVSVAVDGGGLPPVLAGWLAQNTWPESEAFLRDNVSRLLDPRVEVALRELRQSEPGDERIGAYDVILGLVGKAGDLASPLQAPWRPDQPGQPLRETFALDYLLPKATREERKAWDDRLLSLMSTGELSTAQMVALARGVHEVGERTVVVAGERHMERFDYGPANATMFTAVSDVLNLQPEMIQRLTDSTDPAAEEGPFKNALTQVAACRLLPSDKTAWVERIDELRTGLRAKQQALAALLNILLQKMVAC